MRKEGQLQRPTPILARGEVRRQSTESPTRPLRMSMTAAKAASRARVSQACLAGYHKGHNQRHLDNRHGKGEHEGAEWLADAIIIFHIV